MTPFLGPENGPIFGSEKPEKRVHEITKTITLRFSFVVLTDTVTLRQRAEYPATETQQMSPFIRTELPKTNCHFCRPGPLDNSHFETRNKEHKRCQ